MIGCDRCPGVTESRSRGAASAVTSFIIHPRQFKCTIRGGAPDPEEIIDLHLKTCIRIRSRQDPVWHRYCVATPFCNSKPCIIIMWPQDNIIKAGCHLASSVQQ